MAKYSLGVTTGKGRIDLARFERTSNGSLYVIPFPAAWGSTGFHTSFHPGVTYLKTYKPLNPVRLSDNPVCLIRDYFRQNTTNLNLGEEPGIVSLINFENLLQHVNIEKRNITLNGLSMMNAMAIAEVGNIKRSLDRLKQRPIFQTSLAVVHGLNSGTTSFIIDSPSISKNIETRRYSTGTTITFPYDINQIRKLPFVNPYIDPMRQIIEGAKNFLPRNINLGLEELRPGLELDI